MSILDTIAKEFIIMPMVIDLMANPETIVFRKGTDVMAISSGDEQVTFVFTIAEDGVKLVGGRLGERVTKLAEPEDISGRVAARLRLVSEAVFELEAEDLIPADKVEGGEAAATMAAVKKALAAKAARA